MSFDSTSFEGKLVNGDYVTKVNARRAIGVWTRHKKFSSKAERDKALELIEKHSFPEDDAPSSNRRTAEEFKERIAAKKYKTAGRAKTAVGKSHLSEAQKKDVRQHIEAHFSKAKSDSPLKGRKKNRKRGTDGRVLNGAGDSRIVTLFKLSKIPGAFSLLAHLIAKTVDEDKMLEELHEDVKTIASFL